VTDQTDRPVTTEGGALRITHRFAVSGICPIDRARDDYQVQMTMHRDAYVTDDPVTVEAILSECRRLLAVPIFQENFTRELAALFVCGVRTECAHSGVLTVCEIE
jgi:hypothetical protein